MTRRLILGFALFALVVGYVEMRVPDSVSAQGRDAVYQQLAVISDAYVGGTAAVGVLEFGTALTPTMTARLAATGTASATTFLRGDGAWATLGSDFYSGYKNFSSVQNTTALTSTYRDSVSISSVVVPENATVVASYYASRIQADENTASSNIPTATCFIRFPFSGNRTINFQDPKENFSTVLVLTPSAGTYTYTVTFAVSRYSRCLIDDITLLIQVVK